MKNFPPRLSVTWIQQSYKSKRLTPLELATEIVNRVHKYEDYNVWIIKPTLDLIKPYIDALPEYDPIKYPLWGIPFSIKDNIDLKDVPTTAGCKAYEYLPKENATVVENLIKAGAIPVGKTNLDQFATGLVGTRSPYGETKNALQPKLISGGSSSGSAVAVVLGMSAFSLGTDTAGSGRVPASLHGIVGYKAPLGAWSTKGVVPACESLDCVTVFALYLKEALLVDASARSFDYECVWSREFNIPESKLPKKICIGKDAVKFYGKYADVYKAKWESVLTRLEGLGVEIEYIDYTIFQKAASILYDGPWVAQRYSAVGEFVSNHQNEIFPVTKDIILSGNRPQLTATSLFSSIKELKGYSFNVEILLKDSVLIMPTVGGTFERDEVSKDPIATNSSMGLYTNHCNLLDLCAVALPENPKDTTLPFGITIFALANQESLLQGIGEKFLQSQTVLLAVCGLHKKGGSLESQIIELGGYYLKSSKTSSNYKLFKLNTTPAKPGLVMVQEGGNNIEVDVFELPLNKMGNFMQQVSKPLYIGDVHLDNGTIVKGFLCEADATLDAIDLTKEGSFPI